MGESKKQKSDKSKKKRKLKEQYVIQVSHKLQKIPKKKVLESNEIQFRRIEQKISQTNLSKLQRLDECIFDPSMLPILHKFRETKLRTIWIPNEFFHLKTALDLPKLIDPWSKRKFSVDYVYQIIKQRRIGKARLEPIINENQLDDYTYQNVKTKKGLKRRIAGKILDFSSKTKKVVVSKTRALGREAKKLGSFVFELPNKMIDNKQEFFNEKTRGISRRSRGWRYIGGITVGVSTSIFVTPIIGIPAGLAFASVDP